MKEVVEIVVEDNRTVLCLPEVRHGPVGSKYADYGIWIGRNCTRANGLYKGRQLCV